MKVILAEKPSVAKDIARVLSVQNKQDGYLEGNGYAVTWAYGHLGELADAKSYVENPWQKEVLPIIPERFSYKVKDDGGARKQFNVIKDLFKRASEIIVATDAGREGENIFRIIYRLTGVKTPFKRLWISSLTESAIREGFSKLKNGSDYDRLANAAEGREKADWLVGINATISLTLSNSGSAGALSLGRVQTPTLAIICERYLHNINFKPEPYYVPVITLEKAGKKFKSTYQAKDLIKDPALASQIISKVGAKVTCTSAEKKPVTEIQPLLYDLTTLQSDANRKFGFSADKTLKVMQELYETHKVLTYPRTDSRYLSEDIYAELPKLFNQFKAIGVYGSYIAKIDLNGLPKRSVNNDKVSDHHAIIPTGNAPAGLSEDENKIFDLVARRFIAAFSGVCKKDVTTYLFDEVFRSSGAVITEPGWRIVEQEIKDEDADPEDEENQALPPVASGELVPVVGKSVQDKKTKPKPLHTESSLLKAMETAGKDIEDPELREAMKDSGIGTPATRASIIEILIAKRQYVERKKKSLVPTQKGLAVYELVKDKKIGSAALTGEWEKQLKLIETGKLNFLQFLEGIKGYTREIVEDLASVEVSISKQDLGTCPKCKKGKIVEGKKGYGCSEYKGGCTFVIWKEFCNKDLPITAVKALIEGKQTAVIKGFKSKAGNSFETALILDAEFKVVFPEKSEPKQETRTIGVEAWEISEDTKFFKCVKAGKEIAIWKEIAGKKIGQKVIDQLLSGKETDLIEGFKSKANKPFSAKLKLDPETGKVNFVFPDKK
jgi:DNA topoisomerase III